MSHLRIDKHSSLAKRRWDRCIDTRRGSPPKWILDVDRLRVSAFINAGCTGISDLPTTHGTQPVGVMNTPVTLSHPQYGVPWAKKTVATVTPSVQVL